MSVKVLAVVDGIIVDCLPKTEFNVRVEDPNFPTDYVVKAHLSGKMRLNYIKILPGDRVKLELNPYDPYRGRITYRYKSMPPQQGSPPFKKAA